MWLRVLDSAIKIVLYLSIVGGSVYLFRSVWIQTFTTVRTNVAGLAQRRHLRTATYYNKKLAQGLNPVVRQMSIGQHLKDLLEDTLKTQALHSVRKFVYLSLSVGSVVYVLLALAMDTFLFPIIPAAVSIVFPYIILRVRKQRLAIKNSYDIPTVVTLLVTKYRIHKRNMPHALTATIEELPDMPFRRALSRLLIRLTRHTSNRDALDSIRRFNRQTGTVWATQLSMLIYESFVEGINIETSLVELAEDITNIQTSMKKQKLDRTDNLLVAGLPIVLLPGGIAFIYMSITHDVFKYQFGTPIGVFTFVVAVVICTFSFAVAMIFYRPKQDI